MGPQVTRREALGGAAAALALASCGGGDPPPDTGPRPGSGAALLSSLLALKLAAIAAYDACEQVLSGRARRHIGAIRSEKRGSVLRYSHLIEELGGTPPTGKGHAVYARTFPDLRTAEDALRFAEDLEERQVRADLEALTELPDEALRTAVAESLHDDSFHLAVVRVLQGLPAAQGPFVTGAL